MSMISHIEPKNIQKQYVRIMCNSHDKEELSQFDKNEVWNLVPKPQNQSIKWVLKDKYILYKNNFSRGKIDTTRFRKDDKTNFIIVQLYVDDIIFGLTNEKICDEIISYTSVQRALHVRFSAFFILLMCITYEH